MSLSQQIDSKSAPSKLAERGMRVLSSEISRADKGFRRLGYKYPLALMVVGLVAGYATHWMMNKSSNSVSE